MKKNLPGLFAVPVFIVVLLHCTSPIHTTTQSHPVQPVKMLCVFDCVVVSKPYPEIFEIRPAKLLNNLIKQECEERLKGIDCIESVKSIQAVGYRLKRDKKKIVRYNKVAVIDTLMPPFFVDDTNSYLRDNLYLLCNVGKDTTASPVMSRYFKSDSNLSRLKELKRITNSDYCMVNLIYGSVIRRREPVPEVVQFISAMSVGLSVGVAFANTGYETEFQSRSYVINLNTGDIKWYKSYFSHKADAVEKFNQRVWGNKVFKKFTLQKENRCSTPKPSL